MSVAGTYIDYYNTDSVELSYFLQKQEMLMQLIQKKITQEKSSILNKAIAAKQKDVKQYKKDMEKIIFDSIQQGLASSRNGNFNGDLETMANNASGFLLHEGQEAATLMQTFNQSDFLAAYNSFEQVIRDVMNAPGAGITVDKTSFQKLLNSVDVLKQRQMLKEIGNQLGSIGELSGLLVAHDIATNLISGLNQSHAGNKISIEIKNVGDKIVSNPEAGQKAKTTITTDNLIIIKNGDEILFTLNISDKFNTKYSVTKKRTGTVKLKQQTIGTFLAAHPEWSSGIYNTISYHWTSRHKGGCRTDTVYQQNQANMRRAIGGQMLYDSVYGTGLPVDNQYKDIISLVAYGTKIYSTNGILEVPLKRGKFNLAQMANLAKGRASWFENGNWITGQTPRGTNEYVIETKINAFTISYLQSLGQSL